MNISNVTFELSETLKALIPEDRLLSLVDMFAQLDTNQDGKIEIDEYLNFAIARETARLTQKFTAADADQDGRVDFEEFVAVIEPSIHILKRFRELDLDQNGLLSIEEALTIADRLVLPLSPAQVQTLMRDVDHDGDGQITYYEYLGAIAHIGFQ